MVMILDSLFIKIHGKTTAHESWEALAGDFEKRVADVFHGPSA